MCRCALFCGLIGVLAQAGAPGAAADVVIHEIMYHPASWLEGEEFVELRNTGTEVVDLTDWCLDGVAFCFPAGGTLPADGYLVLARDAAQFEATYGFAPDFVYAGELDNGGEALTLRDGGGLIVDQITYSDEPPWPVKADGLGCSLELIDPAQPRSTPRNWRASIAPAGHTVRAANSVAATGLPPWITDVTFQLLPQPMDPLVVAAHVDDAADVQLVYVLDFTDEVSTAMSDAGGGNYSAAIPGQAANVLIRFRIVATGPTGTMQYPRTDDSVFYDGTRVADPGITTAMPIVDWYMDPNEYAQALAHFTTDELEPAIVCYEGRLYDNLGVRVRGQSSRYWPKKNWKFHFAQGHDFHDPARLARAVDQFDLQSNYSDKSYVREILAHETLRDCGAAYCQAYSVRLHKNGQFFGLYTLRTAMDDDFLTVNDLSEDGAWYKAYHTATYMSLANLPNYYQKHTREWEGYEDLHDLLYGVNVLTGPQRHEFLFDNLDLPGLLNYLAAFALIHNNDHVAKNYWLYRDTLGTRRWVMHPWDLDLTFGRNYGAGGGVLSDGIWADNDDVGRVNVSPSHPLFGDTEHQKFDYLWNGIIDALYEDAEIRAMYFRRLRTVMDALLASDYFENRIAELTTPIAPEAALDVATWGQYGQAQTLEQAVDLILNDYLPRRRAHLFVTHQVAGEIPPAQAAAPPIVISEIMYNPAAGPDRVFVELYNPSADAAVDMSGWTLSGADFVFRPGTVLLPQHYGVAVKNDVVFRAAYGAGKFVFGQFAGGLNPNGGLLELRDATGVLIDAVTFDDDSPWPGAPDGGGPSLELVDLAQDNSRPANWAASLVVNGTPGAANSVAGTLPPLAPLWVNEVLPQNNSDFEDEVGDEDPWIEIYNASTETVDLGGFHLTSDYALPMQWSFPLGTLLAGQSWLVVWADNEVGEGPLHANFALNPAGGVIGLMSVDGGLIDYVNYPALAVDQSFGKFPDGSPAALALDAPTPGAANVHTAASPLILNEYNAVDSGNFLRSGGSDTYWGRVLGNGGDWFELVVTVDHLDVRGWQLVISDDTGGPEQDVETLTLSAHALWSDLRIGTLLTISENLPDDVSFDPVQGDWWINVQAIDGGPSTYITPESFKVSNKNWQLTIKNAAGQVVFGPAGEGIMPSSGIGGDEICMLEEDPSWLIRPTAGYDDGIHSTFGAPNIFDDGVTAQDFSALRDLAAPCLADADCEDGNPCTEDTCLGFAGCSNVPRSDGTPCEDGFFCNGAETCLAGACVNGSAPCVDPAHCDESADVCLPCTGHAECDDANPCTVDECVSGHCVHTPQPDATPCDDGLYCTTNDACYAGECAGGDALCGGVCEQCDELSQTCVRCVFDLYTADGFGVLNGGDFSLFAAYYGSCYSPGDPALVADFDGDGCVGGGDFGLFAACYAQACSDCASCFVPEE